MLKDLFRQGLSISELARLSGHDRKTIRSRVHEPLQPSPRVRKRRASKLDPFVAYLNQRMAAGVLNASKLYDEIHKQGYSGGKSIVRAFVQPQRAARQPQATVRFETEPGEQAQVDWGSFGYIEQYGCRRRLYGFVMSLGWSRAIYLEFTTSVDAAWWLRCHQHAFAYFGGVPRQMLHDNLKTAVLERAADGSIHWNPRYLDFADRHGFRPQACQPYRAQTKGKVESGVRYVRGNFWPGLRFADLADLNRQAREWLDTVANVRVHGTTGEVPFTRLPLEQLSSLLGRPEYDTSLISFRRSSKDCLVSYEGNYYSVPAAHARHTLTLKACENGQLLILNAQDELIARHTLVAEHNQRIVIPAHYQSLQPTARPTPRASALQLVSVSVRNHLPDAPLVEVRPLQWYEQRAEVAA